MTTISEETERIEKQILSPYAQLAAESKGREQVEERDPLRTCYQRDRDRIVHSKAFRRLKHKTQVFFAPDGDHYRVRLTHTLETAQIARTIARALRLNEDLTEAIALGHDIGHTPFGHVGEDALTRLLGRKFKHSEQSLRIVEVLEGGGLNLTWEVRDGIVGHTWTQAEPSTLEGCIIRYADRIAYLNHDVDDAVRAGIIAAGDAAPGTHSQRINAMVMAVVEGSLDKPKIAMREDALTEMLQLRDYLFTKVYLADFATAGRARAETIIEDLFTYYVKHLDELPEENKDAPGDDATRVADFIAGMTDRYAATRHEEITK